MQKYLAFILAAVLSFSIVSCTPRTENRYEAHLENWVGKSERELVTVWGIPDKQYQMDAHTRMLAYVSRNTYFQEPAGFSTCLGGYRSHFGISNCYGGYPSVRTSSCETIFTIRKGRVVKWGHRGNDCRA
jgi:hypothetical protein